MSLYDGDAREVLAGLGVTEPKHVARVAGGWDTAIWRVEDATATYALRVFRPEQASQCEREQAVLAAGAAAGLPVPAVHASTVWRDRPALLMAWCAGEPVLDAVRAHPWRVWTLGVAMGQLHARIHSAPVPETLRQRLPDWITRAGEAELALRQRLSGANRSPGVLLHLDYHPLNVMAADGDLTGVLDWANASVGDPRADIARTVSLLRLAPLPPGAASVLASGLRVVLESAWRVGYGRVRGEPRDMALFYAWAGSMMQRDLEPKLGRPGVWLQRSDLARMRRWTQTWKRRAGLRPY
ncbi:MAG: phosphotransferase [Chloroflexi bacterium]|nr:phosphotransferase [Chloroflexota bacterium]